MPHSGTKRSFQRSVMYVARSECERSSIRSLNLIAYTLTYHTWIIQYQKMHVTGQPTDIYVFGNNHVMIQQYQPGKVQEMRHLCPWKWHPRKAAKRWKCRRSLRHGRHLENQPPCNETKHTPRRQNMIDPTGHCSGHCHLTKILLDDLMMCLKIPALKSSPTIDDGQLISFWLEILFLIITIFIIIANFSKYEGISFRWIKHIPISIIPHGDLAATPPHTHASDFLNACSLRHCKFA